MIGRKVPIATCYVVLIVLPLYVHQAASQSPPPDEKTLSCDPQSRLATIFPPKKVTESRDISVPFFGEQRCQLPGGTDVLVRWGHPESAPDVGDERYITRLSIWVNQAKWVDAVVIIEDGGVEETFTPPNRLEVPGRIQISSKGMTTCNRLLYGKDPWPWPSQAHCSFIPTKELPNQPDIVEFPAKNKQRPATGTTQVLESRADRLCSAIVSTLRDFRIQPSRFGGESLDTEDPNHAKEPVGDGFVLLFDIDNSNQARLVVEHTESSGLSETQRYLAFSELGLQRLEATHYKDLDDVTRNAEKVYPDLWDVCEDGSPNQCPSDQRYWLPFSITNANGKAVHFRDENISMTPFRFDSLTYFAVQPAAFDKPNVTFIVKPLPMGQYELTCSLETFGLHL